MDETETRKLLETLGTSVERLGALASPLDAHTIRQRSYCTEWSIAQVLSHIGSGAELFELWLDAGLTGEAAGTEEAAQPVWDKWDAKQPEEQVGDALSADRALVARLTTMSTEDRAKIHLSLGEMDIDFATIVLMRLFEHALHSWDIAVALDDSAVVARDAVEILVDNLAMMVAWMGKPTGEARRVEVVTSGPGRRFVLEVGERASLSKEAGGDTDARLEIPAEGFVRLVYGRLDPLHTPPLEVDGVELETLRKTFPGP